MSAGPGKCAHALLGIVVLACAPGISQNPPKQARSVPLPSPIQFTDVSRALGIDWQHVNGATDEKHLIETMGGGGAFLDFNRDGRLDIFLVQSGCHKFSKNCKSGSHALYQQSVDGRFTEVTLRAGIRLDIYGMGVAVADYDNDGYSDLYVTGFPHNMLFRNNGNGIFTDVSAKAGVSSNGWSTSAAFFDFDRDGWLDLFVGRYLEWGYDKNVFCGERRPGYRSYCHPDQFAGISSRLYRNNRDGTFTDVSKVAGIAAHNGKALGVVTFDFNDDAWPDVYVANDAVRNFLFKNNGDGTFTEIGMLAEVAYGLQGKPESGMGTDAADFDGDGRADLFVTNIDYEPNNLYRNLGDETFSDVTVTANLGSVALQFSGFGTRFLDYDNDGDLDIVVLNGHVLDNVHLFRSGVTFAERPFLLENRGGRFEEVGEKSGPPFQEKYAGRALASGDFDNDGDVDLLAVMNGGRALLLRNDGGNRNVWIGLELSGSRSGRDAIGARVTLTATDRTSMREVVGGGSYCAAHDLRIIFGLASAQKAAKVEIHWPSGAISVLENPALRRYHRIEEPKP